MVLFLQIALIKAVDLINAGDGCSQAFDKLWTVFVSQQPADAFTKCYGYGAWRLVSWSWFSIAGNKIAIGNHDEVNAAGFQAQQVFLHGPLGIAVFHAHIGADGFGIFVSGTVIEQTAVLPDFALFIREADAQCRAQKIRTKPCGGKLRPSQCRNDEQPYQKTHGTPSSLGNSEQLFLQILFVMEREIPARKKIA